VLGLGAALLAFVALKKQDSVNVIALCGLIIGLVVASMSFTSIVQTTMLKQKVSNITVPSLEEPPEITVPTAPEFDFDDF
jgi:hypothetical protein